MSKLIRRLPVLKVALLIGAASLVAASGPASAQFTKKPSKILQLNLTIQTTGFNYLSFRQISPTGTDLGDFSVPSAQVFVMTSITIVPSKLFNSSDTGDVIQLVSSDGVNFFRTRFFWEIPYGSITHIPFPVGVVFAPDTDILIRALGGPRPVTLTITITGYLAPNV